MSSLELNNKKFKIPIKINEYNPDFDVVGIDLGTTECSAAVIRKNGAEFVVLDNLTSLRTMPSYIIYDDQHPKCGQIAVNRLRNKSKYIVFDSKRILGRDLDEIIMDPLWPFNIREINNEVRIELANMSIVKSPEEISGVLLKHIKKCVDEFQGRNIKEVVIAIPSTFTQKQANATLRAAKLGGWENIHFIPEPVAAAFAYCTKKDIENDSKILVFDCGGEVIDNQINVLSYDGDSYLGGRDYDNLLFNYFNGVLIHKYNIDVMASSKKYVLMQKCNEIKCTLSVEKRFWLDVNEFDPNNDVDIIPITINDFEAMADSYKLTRDASGCVPEL